MIDWSDIKSALLILIDDMERKSQHVDPTDSEIQIFHKADGLLKDIKAEAALQGGDE